MEKLNLHLFAALEQRGSASLCGPAGCGEFVGATRYVESAIRPLSLFLLRAFFKTLWLGWKERPAVFVAGSGLTAPIVWTVARAFRGRAVVYLHGLDLVASSRLYQWLWLPFIRGCDLAIANSENTKRQAVEKGLRTLRLSVLNPGVEMPEPGDSADGQFRKRLNLGSSPLLLSVGRLTQRKGLAEFVEKALPHIVTVQPEVILVVIGEEASDALNSRGGSERERIQAAAKRGGVEHHLRLLGRCDEAVLQDAYYACDLHVFPVLSLSGDVEGFGMVALEAAAHGLPTVAFSVGGVPDAVLDGKTGALVASGDYEAFVGAVLAQLEKTSKPSLHQACRDFAQSKAWPAFSERLNELLDRLD
ncbi:glycosyltransferase family 4 protein [Dyella kyungheensis]|uniref:glycosyltransferase family 4 protein n=1 Tax=Dyella kyungheensis TaxID=1242174 RepID=UPI003CF9A40E